MVKELVDEGKVPRVVVMVNQHNKNLYTGYAGFRTMKGKPAVDADVVFSAPRFTVPVVSAGIMILRDENKLSLSDPAYTYIPEMKNVMVENPGGFPKALSRPISIEDMLSSQTGLAASVVAGGG